MKKPVLETHYGVEAWTNVKMDKLREKECLCLNCARLWRKGPAECPKAKILFLETLGKYGMAFAVTRCARWEEDK